MVENVEQDATAKILNSTMKWLTAVKEIKNKSTKSSVLLVGINSNETSIQDFNDNYQIIQRVKSLQGQLRYLALEANAGFVCIPEKLNDNHSNNNSIANLKKYLLHLLYPESFTFPDLQIEVWIILYSFIMQLIFF